MSDRVRRRTTASVAIGAAVAAAVSAVVITVLAVDATGPDGPAPATDVTDTASPRSVPAAAVTAEPAPATSGPVASGSFTVEVPAIEVRTGPVTELGLAGDGTLEVPGDAVTVGWYTGGPAPGERGPAVLAGHVNYNHVPGVFGRLTELRAGDAVLVREADGTAVPFTVYRVDRYPKSRFPSARVYGDTEEPELRLITCGGTFDASTGNYRDNVVAYARLD